ncbi:cell surface glycoprotein 1-like isoform X2 [Eriocheir sinensis]|uniref:cell surface glycoprotein 1-like isoform X2 n=1 Tax=Eriocheir sinensis TaxID=95602 RepID=UPI0021C7E4AB|nr:cell surface glycoprotein 1-like isoform X2 [Eriocheir sinensis]
MVPSVGPLGAGPVQPTLLSEPRGSAATAHAQHEHACTTVTSMPVHWSWEMETRLIELVRSSPALWNVNSPLFTKKSLKKKLYSRIATDLKVAFPNRDGLTSDAVMTKFNILRSSFKRELAKIKAIKSSSGTNHIPKWKTFDSLRFLTDTVSPEPSLTDTVPPEPSLTDTVPPEPSLTDTVPPEPSLPNLGNNTLSESQLSNGTMLVHVDAFMSDDDINYQSDSEPSPPSVHTSTPPPSVPTSTPPPSVPTPTPPPSKPTPTPPPSQTTPMPPPSQHTQGTRPKTNKSIKRVACDKTCNSKRTASEEALALLKSSFAEPIKEDLPYAAGIIARNWIASYPEEMHLQLLAKLTTFMAEADRKARAGNEMNH